MLFWQFFKDNANYHSPNFNSKLGIYNEKCGLHNVTMSWGHDEYMYLVCHFLILFKKILKILSCAKLRSRYIVKIIVLSHHNLDNIFFVCTPSHHLDLDKNSLVFKSCPRVVIPWDQGTTLPVHARLIRVEK